MGIIALLHINYKEMVLAVILLRILKNEHAKFDFMLNVLFVWHRIIRCLVLKVLDEYYNETTLYQSNTSIVYFFKN